MNEGRWPYGRESACRSAGRSADRSARPVPGRRRPREQIAEIKALFRGGAEIYRTSEVGRALDLRFLKRRGRQCAAVGGWRAPVAGQGTSAPHAGRGPAWDAGAGVEGNAGAMRGARGGLAYARTITPLGATVAPPADPRRP